MNQSKASQILKVENSNSVNFSQTILYHVETSATWPELRRRAEGFLKA
jgi:hypothetical protein